MTTATTRARVPSRPAPTESRRRLHNRSPRCFQPTEDGLRSIRENSAAGSNVGARFRATDGNNDRLTYTFAGSDAFEIDASSGQLTTKAELDREDQPAHSLTVTATDPSNLSVNLPVTVTVEDVNEAPVVSGPATVNDYVENDTSAAAFYSADDPEGAPVTWRLSGRRRE